MAVDGDLFDKILGRDVGARRARLREERRHARGIDPAAARFRALDVKGATRQNWWILVHDLDGWQRVAKRSSLAAAQAHMRKLAVLSEEELKPPYFAPPDGRFFKWDLAIERPDGSMMGYEYSEANRFRGVEVD